MNLKQYRSFLQIGKLLKPILMIVILASICSVSKGQNTIYNKNWEDSVKKEMLKTINHPDILEDSVKIKSLKNTNYSNIFDHPEEYPEYPGGEEALRDFMKTNTKYPKSLMKSGIEGKVYVRFVVDENGDVKNVSIARKLHPKLDKEALRVVKLIEKKKWNPGKFYGKPVNVWYTIPVKFELSKK